MSWLDGWGPRETIVHLKRRYNPSLKLAWDIARALDATIDELFLLY